MNPNELPLSGWKLALAVIAEVVILAYMIVFVLLGVSILIEAFDGSKASVWLANKCRAAMFWKKRERIPAMERGAA